MQYKKHNVSNWLTENGNKLKWRNENELETLGIWMWPEIFTHDFENGKKVAVILLNTRGNRNNLRDFRTLFTLTTMLSSVQCYTTRENIEEIDLLHYDLLEKLDLNGSNQVQKFLFIIQNWIDKFDTSYGLQASNVLYNFVSASINKPSEVQMFENRLDASFKDVYVFFVPYPNQTGSATDAIQRNLNKNSHQEEFNDKQLTRSIYFDYIKELTSSLFSPKNLKIKQFHGQNVFARDFVDYLQAFSTVFDGEMSLDPENIQKVSQSLLHSWVFLRCNIFGINLEHARIVIHNYYINFTMKQLKKNDYFDSFCYV